MEELKKRIEESARKVGMQDGLEGDEKRLLRQPPPDVEWWDINLLSHRSYDAVPDPSVHISAMLEQSKLPNSGLLIYGKDSPIDHYIQHPVPIPAPTDKFEAQPRNCGANAAPPNRPTNGTASKWVSFRPIRPR